MRFSQQAGQQPRSPRVAPGTPLTHDDLGDISGAGIAQHLARNILAGDRHRVAAQRLGQAQRVGDAVLVGIGQGVGLSIDDVNGDPFNAARIGEPRRRSYQAASVAPAADADQQPVAGRPGPCNTMTTHVFQHLLVDAVGGGTHRQLTQRREIAGLKVALACAARLLVAVDLACIQPLYQLVWRQVDQLDLVGALQHGIG